LGGDVGGVVRTGGEEKNGAADVTRTHDLRITNAILGYGRTQK